MNKIEDIRQAIAQEYPEFGINKANEIVRLVYEIAKRERIPYRSLLTNIPHLARDGAKRFFHLKNYLMAKRFPNLSEDEYQDVLLNELQIDPGNECVSSSKVDMNPSRFFVEEIVTFLSKERLNISES